MFYLYVLLFFICMNLNALAMDIVPCTSTCQQEQSAFAQLPNEILCEIANRLPQADVAHVRQTCKMLHERFIPRIVPTAVILKKMNLVGTREEAADYSFFIGESWTVLEYWQKIFEIVGQHVRRLIPLNQPLLLDLNGTKYVEKFMYVDHPECSVVKKLVVRSCYITSERDNFFKASMWQQLRYIDLTDNFLGQRDKQVHGAGWDSLANIWPSLSALPNLKVLILRNNRILTLPQELLSMTGLILLDMRDNLLTSQQLDELALRLPSTTILR